MEVLKRSSKRQKFSMAKLKRGIQRAARDAKLTRVQQREVVRTVAASVAKGLKGRRSIKAAALRRKVLTRLDRTSRATASAWRRYDRKRRR
ncbi:MAG: ATP cone domain-containing protein [Nanoarchaeota archaeon]